MKRRRAPVGNRLSRQTGFHALFSLSESLPRAMQPTASRPVDQRGGLLITFKSSSAQPRAFSQSAPVCPLAEGRLR